MTRLIDADALLELIAKSGIYANAREINNAITNAPTIQREGWVSVPIEPTDEMKYQAVKEAGYIILQEVYPNGKYKQAVSLDSEMFGIAYKAMIQAAPTDKE